MRERREDKVTEERHQAWLAQWLDLAGVVWCHVPNGGARNAIVGAKLKGQGVKRGVPDVVIFTPPPASPRVAGVALELKVKGGRVSPDQRSWLEALDGLGWQTKVAYGFREAVDWLESLGYRAGADHFNQPGLR